MSNAKLQVLADLVSKVNSYMSKNFPKRVLLKDKKMISEVNYEVYGFNGIEILVRDCGEYVRYYPLIPSIM